ncbi:MAG: alkaline phosphatase family protein [Muribaculaceae bacterium]|nr:alkaline phosphatase family protein [Muribaculaceae bacterium]
MKRLLTSVAVGLAGIQGIYPAGDSRPKLLVGIMVDQLRTDYLENLRDMFSTGGFRRLMDNGLFIKDLDFNVEPGDAASSSAIIQTGAYPRQNGVTGAFIYDPATKSLRPVFQDETFIGNFTNETYSPASLRVTTLTDELSVETSGKGRIHSIAPDPAQAIILAGHTGNSAFWINDETGRWSSTTFYSNPPAILQNRNYNSPLISRLDTMKWEPLRKSEPYPQVDSQQIKDGFRYTFPRSDRDVFNLYKHSPYINSDITQAATEYISELNLGKDRETTDVLNIAYTLAPFTNLNSESYRYELQDAYLRLDKDLEKLFSTLDKQVGKDNILVYLVSTGYFTEPAIDNAKYRLPGGTFSVKRATSLLNAYLAAKYGNGAFIDSFVDNQIYLSKPTLEEKNLDVNTVAQEAKDFLVRMSGVADAFTISELMSPAISQLEAMRESVDPKTSGDIYLLFNPGWKVIDDTRFPQIEKEHKTDAYLAPAFIMGQNIKSQIIEKPVEAVEIAPTIAGALKIRPPNSSNAKPIKLD